MPVEILVGYHYHYCLRAECGKVLLCDSEPCEEPEYVECAICYLKYSALEISLELYDRG